MAKSFVVMKSFSALTLEWMTGAREDEKSSQLKKWFFIFTTIVGWMRWEKRSASEESAERHNANQTMNCKTMNVTIVHNCKKLINPQNAIPSCLSLFLFISALCSIVVVSFCNQRFLQFSLPLFSRLLFHHHHHQHHHCRWNREREEFCAKLEIPFILFYLHDINSSSSSNTEVSEKESKRKKSAHNNHLAWDDMSVWLNCTRISCCAIINWF